MKSYWDKSPEQLQELLLSLFTIDLDIYDKLAKLRAQVDDISEQQQDSSLLGLFQIDLDNYANIEMGLMYHLQSLTPSEIFSWPYFEYEIRVEKLNDILKKKQDAEKDANKGAQSQTQSYTNPSKQADSFLNKAKGSIPKIPNNISNIKLPKI